MPGECWKNVSGFISAYEHVRAKLLEAYFVAVFSFLGSTAHPFTANLVALLRGNERIQAKEHDLLRFARPSRKELSAELELRVNAGFRSQCLRFPSVAGPILLSRRNGALIGLKLSIMSKPLLRTPRTVALFAALFSTLVSIYAAPARAQDQILASFGRLLVRTPPTTAPRLWHYPKAMWIPWSPKRMPCCGSCRLTIFPPKPLHFR